LDEVGRGRWLAVDLLQYSRCALIHFRHSLWNDLWGQPTLWPNCQAKIAGTFLCEGCAAINNTNINNMAFGVDGLGNRIRQIPWAGAKYAVTDKLDVMAAYYHYNQNSYFSTATGGPAACSGSEHSQCAGTFNAISGVIDWLFAPKWDVYLGIMSTQVNGGLANGYLQRNNIATTAGLRFRF
jgi:hypothetical protein